MTFLQLLLTFSSQNIRCDAAMPQRSLIFTGKIYGESELKVTRDDRDFDSSQSRWTISVFDLQEAPLTDFYLERAAERNMEWLGGAIYLSPNEYTEAVQPEITVYVWLPPTAFNSIWNVSPAVQSGLLQATLNLSVPFRGSALNYSPGGPEDHDKVWNAERENPLLLQGTEFYISPIKHSR